MTKPLGYLSWSASGSVPIYDHDLYEEDGVPPVLPAERMWALVEQLFGVDLRYTHEAVDAHVDFQQAVTP